MSEINTKELRLGNLFVDRIGQICEVERIEKRFEECRIVSKHTALTHLPVKPIPLTEDVLLKCGFERTDYCIEKYPVQLLTLSENRGCFFEYLFFKHSEYGNRYETDPIKYLQ